MKNLSKVIHFDKEQKFYTEYLSVYENSNSGKKLVKVDDKNIYDEYIDAFAFFIACGVIIFQKSSYYIDLEKLAHKTKSYEKTCEEIGIGLSKRTI